MVLDKLKILFRHGFRFGRKIMLLYTSLVITQSWLWKPGQQDRVVKQKGYKSIGHGGNDWKCRLEM